MPLKVHALVQLALESTWGSLGFLRPRILLRRTVEVLRNGHVAGWILRRHLLLHVRAWLLSDEVAEALDFVEDHALHLRDVVDDLEVEVEGLRADGFVGCIVPDVQVLVLQGGFDGDALRWVEGEHLVQQVERVGVGVAEERLERHLLHVREIPDIFLRSGRADPRERLFIWRAQVVQDLIELVDVVPALEERLAAEQFRKNASYGPDIDYANQWCLDKKSDDLNILAFV